ncbi:phage gp6-like head-tail connector protein [Cereibacter sphaeroides]|nr:phage gp6-like head-tail connector protein [Cereibacter sphaeroides]
MAAQTPLALLTAQLNLDPDTASTEADLLSHKLAVAEAWVAGHIGDAFNSACPAHVEAALMLAAHLYEQREAVAFGVSAEAVPFGVRDLLAPFREQVTGHVGDL